MEWIKVCKETIDKPEMQSLADLMSISREQAFGYWFRVYSWADSQTCDGFCPRLTHAKLANLTHTPEKFCRLLGSEEVGWVVETNGEEDGRLRGLVFRKWDRHNGQCAKQRAQKTRRMETYRRKNKA
jgi:hypothetical protein